jgi:hypothetical protein
LAFFTQKLLRLVFGLLLCNAMKHSIKREEKIGT